MSVQVQAWVRSIAVLTVLAASQFGAAAQTEGATDRSNVPPAGSLASFVVLLDRPTRWDAAVAAGWEAPVSSGWGSPRNRHATLSATQSQAVRAAEDVIVRASKPVEQAVEAAGGVVVSRYATAAAGLLIRMPAGSDRLLALVPGVVAVWPAPRAVVAGRVGGGDSVVPTLASRAAMSGRPAVDAKMDPMGATRAELAGRPATGESAEERFRRGPGPSGERMSASGFRRGPRSPGATAVSRPTNAGESIRGLNKVMSTQVDSISTHFNGFSNSRAREFIRRVTPGRDSNLAQRLFRRADLGGDAILGNDAILPDPPARHAPLSSPTTTCLSLSAADLPTIAIVDSGVDYTHAALGGPGEKAAYVAAAAAAERVDDVWAGQPLFPNRRVVGGFDLAGPRYAPGCSPAGEQQGFCTIRPVPDPDPLDTLGHGTHVAGIAAGSEVPVRVPAGVAPAAPLVALKIFGSTGETDLLLDALEWVMDANLGAAGRPRVDVVNLSLGIPYGANVLKESGALARLAASGVVVVASAGNDGDIPFIAAAPGIVPEVLTVASFAPEGQHGWDALLEVAGEAPERFGGDAVFHQAWSPDPAGPLTAPMVDVGRSCPATPEEHQPEDKLLADPRGAVGMFQLAFGAGGSNCTAEKQALRLQQAGAVGAFIATTVGVEAGSAWGSEPLVDIPVWMANGALERKIADTAQAGKAMTVTLQRRPEPEQDRVISPFSSRGPARTGVLKPDLAAPGQLITAALMGSGSRGVAFSGSSMAAPYAAGAVAKAWAAQRAAGRAPSGREMAALMVNSADHLGVRQGRQAAEPAAISRMGAGAVDVAAAGAGEVVLLAGDLASLDLGTLALSDTLTKTSVVTLVNLSDAPRDFVLSARFRDAAEAGAGLHLTFQPAEIHLESLARRAVTVMAVIVPDALPAWELRGGEVAGSGAALTRSEVDGWIQASRADRVAARAPFRLLARRASIAVATARHAAGAPPSAIQLDNPFRFPTSVDLFAWIGEDRAESGLPDVADLDAVGVRATPDGLGYTVVEFLAHTRGARLAAHATRTVVELDTDWDNQPDFRVTTEDAGLLRSVGAVRDGNVMAVLETAGGGGFGPQARYFADLDVGGRYTGLPFRLEDTGLTPSTLWFQFRVRVEDRLEEGVGDTLLQDLAPDGGRWWRFDDRDPDFRLLDTHVELAGGAERELALPVGTGKPGNQDDRLGWMVLFPGNAPLVDVVSLRTERAPRVRIYLPKLLNGGRE